MRRIAIVQHLAVLLIALSMVPQAASAATSVQSDCSWIFPNFTQAVSFIPPHTAGDREFDGHGPRVDASVMVVVHPAGIYADIAMTAKETRSDWTTGSGTVRRWFYRADSGYTIKYAAGPALEGIVGANEYEAWNKSYVDTDHRAEYFHIDWSKLITSVKVVGDTKGKDVGYRDGTRIVVNTPLGAVCVAKTLDVQSPFYPFGAVCVMNETNQPIVYRYNWADDDEWKSTTLQPNYAFIHSYTYKTPEHSSPRFNITFDEGSHSTKYKSYYLGRDKAVVPNCDDAKRYAFRQKSDGSIDIFGK